jgi:hypothetical protein
MPADKPVLFLQAIERTYRQGDNLLNICVGPSLRCGPGSWWR